MNFERELQSIKQRLSSSSVNENPIIFSKFTIKHLYFMEEKQSVINNKGNLSNKYKISYRIALVSNSDAICYTKPIDIVKELNKELKQAKDKKLIRFMVNVLYDSDGNKLNEEQFTTIMNTEDLTLNQPKEYDKVLELISKVSNG